MTEQGVATAVAVPLAAIVHDELPRGRLRAWLEAQQDRDLARAERCAAWERQMEVS